MHTLLSIDHSIFLLINTQWTAAWLDMLMKGITELGHVQWLFGIFWVIWMIRSDKKGRQAGLAVLLAVLAADSITTHFLKPFFERARPWAVLPETRVLADLTKVSRFSFPSNHAANSAAVAVFGVLFIRKNWIRCVLALLVLLVCYSRIYVGVHFPADVIGGFLVGAFFAAAGFLLLRRVA